MAHALPSLTGPVDLGVLETFLLSGRAPGGAMAVCGIDGLLSGIAAGPEAIMPGEWMPVIWQGGTPAFSGSDEARRIVGVITCRYDEIVAQLCDEPEAYAPVLSSTAGNSNVCADWVDGFLSAMALRKNLWSPLFRSPSAVFLLLPMLAVCPSAEIRSALLQDLPAAAGLAAEAPGLIPSSVVGIHDFWRRRRGRGA